MESLTLSSPAQGVLCDLTKGGFGPFVAAAVNSENFLIKPNLSMDAAKALSWVPQLQFKRIALCNEIQGRGGASMYVAHQQIHAYT